MQIDNWLKTLLQLFLGTFLWYILYSVLIGKHLDENKKDNDNDDHDYNDDDGWEFEIA